MRVRPENLQALNYLHPLLRLCRTSFLGPWARLYVMLQLFPQWFGSEQIGKPAFVTNQALGLSR